MQRAGNIREVEDWTTHIEFRYGCCLSALAGLANNMPASLPRVNMVGFCPCGKPF